MKNLQTFESFVYEQVKPGIPFPEGTMINNINNKQFKQYDFYVDFIRGNVIISYSPIAESQASIEFTKDGKTVTGEDGYVYVSRKTAKKEDVKYGPPVKILKDVKANTGKILENFLVKSDMISKGNPNMDKNFMTKFTKILRAIAVTPKTMLPGEIPQSFHDFFSTVVDDSNGKLDIFASFTETGKEIAKPFRVTLKKANMEIKAPTGG